MCISTLPLFSKKFLKQRNHNCAQFIVILICTDNNFQKISFVYSRVSRLLNKYSPIIIFWLFFKRLNPFSMVLHLLFFELFFYFFFFFHFLTPNYRVTWVAAFIPESRVPFLSKMLCTKFYMTLLLCSRLICQMKWKRDFLKNFNLYQQIWWNIEDSNEMLFPNNFHSHQPLIQQLTRSLQFYVHPRYIR